MLETVGRYAIEAQVSDGTTGTSTVYKATDRDRDRTVALKLLDPEILGGLPDDQVTPLLRMAAEGASTLNHAAISRVRDVGCEAEFHFVCTDWVEGVSLFDIVKEHGPFPLPEALRVVMDVLAGLGYAHENGVLHADVKLENFMLQPDGNTVLNDYGVLKDFSAADAPQEDRWVASVTSLAPEVVLGEEPGIASDLYGVGIVLYELLTGDSAFPVRDGEDPWDVARRRVEDPPPRLPAWLEAVPPELGMALTRALARDPRSRFETANEFTRSLIGVAVRHRLEIPDAVPLATIPDRFPESRRRTQECIDDAALPEPVELDEIEMTPETVAAQARRSRRGLWELALCFVAALSIWVLTGARVSYLSVGTFPPAAEISVVAVPEEATANVDEFEESAPERVRVLGAHSADFVPLLSGSRILRIRWKGDPGWEEDFGPIELVPRTHLEINVTAEGRLTQRTVRVPSPGLGWLPALPSWGGIKVWWANLSAESPLEFKTQAVEPKADGLLSEHRLQEAVAAYKKFAKIDPRAARRAADRLTEAAFLRRQRAPEWAVEAFKEALHLDPDHARAHVMLGGLLRDQGEDTGVVYHLAKGAARLAPGVPGKMPSNKEAALAEVRRRLKGQPGDAALARHEAYLLQRLGRDQEAEAAYWKLASTRGWARPDQY